MLLITIDQLGKPTGFPITSQNFRLLYPDVSFPSDLTEDDTLPFGYSPYEFADKPELGTFEVAEEASPIRVEGGWAQLWTVREMTDNEKSSVISGEWFSVRSSRNSKLADCDWTQLPDAPLTNVQTAAWATYRQALRNVTDQADPFNIVWPASPSA